MIKRIYIRGKRYTFVLRHRWDDGNKLYFTRNKFLSKFEISIWLRTSEAVASKNIKNPDDWSKNTVNCYMWGFTFLVFSVWVSFDNGAAKIEI